MSASKAIPFTPDSTPEEERQKDDQAFVRVLQFMQKQQARIAELEAQIEAMQGGYLKSF